MINPRRIRNFYLKLMCIILTSVFLVSASISASLIFSISNEGLPVSFAVQAAELESDGSVLPLRKIIDPQSEIRGVWIASVFNINYPSKKGLTDAQLKKEIDDILDTVEKNNLNAVYFQVRPSSDALYNSSIFPSSYYVTGKQGDPMPGNFDPLEYLINEAHGRNIFVHAWVNPLRITDGSSSSHDISALSQSNPARMNPDWTVPYADGKLYYNPGLPEVHSLVADGVEEIAANYDVDGIVFDDYFYPYPVSGAVFDDGEAYEKYGNGMSVGDWRRDNINKIVKSCYDRIKSVNSECQFGIAPFGIWKNNDGKNGGSDTNGLQSYSDIYCDSLAWIKGGYIDYIAPQIYWQFSTSVAPYGTLARWWNQVLDEYPEVDLIICHAAYRSEEWGTENEIRSQVSFARSVRAYTGSIFYGYEAIRGNEKNLTEQLTSLYREEIVYSGVEANGRSVSVSSPANGSYLDYSSTYIIGSSDPAYPLYLDGKSVGRTKQGYFSVYVPLVNGKNTFVFEHKSEKLYYTVTRGKTAITPSGEVKMDTFLIKNVYPMSENALASGSKITLKATAPSGSSVSAKVGGAVYNLVQTTPISSSSGYIEASFSAVITLPSAKEGEITDLGKIVFTSKKGSDSAEKEGGRMRVLGKNTHIGCEIVSDEAPLREYGGSDGYEFMMQPKGTIIYATSVKDGKYYLKTGGYITSEHLTETGENQYKKASLGETVFFQSDSRFDAVIETDYPPAISGDIAGSTFVLTLYSASMGNEVRDLPYNPLFEGLSVEKGENDTVLYKFALKDAENFYGFKFLYEDEKTVVSFKMPRGLGRIKDKPLEGRTIVLDAGHGGSDIGAKGPYGEINEKDLNLAIVLKAASILEEKGANVVLTRDGDKTMVLSERSVMLNLLEPDLAVSIHQNSMPYNADITKIRGLLGLYYSDAGKLLTRVISSFMSDGLNAYMRSNATQMLAMANNHKFPSTLIEVSFITSVEEYDALTRAGTAERAAASLCDGIIQYYQMQGEFLEAK